MGRAASTRLRTGLSKACWFTLPEKLRAAFALSMCGSRRRQPGDLERRSFRSCGRWASKPNRRCTQRTLSSRPNRLDGSGFRVGCCSGGIAWQRVEDEGGETPDHRGRLSTLGRSGQGRGSLSAGDLRGHNGHARRSFGVRSCSVGCEDDLQIGVFGERARTGANAAHSCHAEGRGFRVPSSALKNPAKVYIWIVAVGGTRLFIAAATSKDANARLKKEIQQIVESIRFAATSHGRRSARRVGARQ